jgi:hypothetical protein
LEQFTYLTNYTWYDPEISLGSVLTPAMKMVCFKKGEYGGGINLNFGNEKKKDHSIY